MKLSELTEQLQQESNATIQQAQQTANEELNKFASDLKLQLGSAATTFRTDLGAAKTELSTEIETYKTGLADALKADSTVLTTQLECLKADIAKWTPRLTWAVKAGIFLPIALTLIACALMIGTTWLWMPTELWNLRTSHQTMQDGKSYLVIDDPSWVTCNVSETPGTRVSRPCKTIGKKGAVTLPMPSNPAK